MCAHEVARLKRGVVSDGCRLESRRRTSMRAPMRHQSHVAPWSNRIDHEEEEEEERRQSIVCCCHHDAKPLQVTCPSVCLSVTGAPSSTHQLGSLDHPQDRPRNHDDGDRPILLGLLLSFCHHRIWCSNAKIRQGWLSRETKALSAIVAM